MKTNPSKRQAKRAGSATVEFAILLPILITIGLLCVDFGRFAHSYIAVTNAARAGAAFGSMKPVTATSLPTWNAGIRAAVEDELAGNAWFDRSQLIVDQDSFGENNGMRRVRVEVSYPFQTIVSWSLIPGYNDPVMLSRVVVMRGIR